MNHCKDCDWWDGPDEDGWGECDMLCGIDPDRAKAKFVCVPEPGERVVSGYFATAPDFGCVNFKEREDSP